MNKVVALLGAAFVSFATQAVVSNPGTAHYAGKGDLPVLYVATNGDDANDGLSQTTAKATIQAAVDALGAEGGTVNVAKGEYVFAPPAANQPLVTITAAVEVVGMTGNPADVVIRRTGTEAMGFKL